MLLGARLPFLGKMGGCGGTRKLRISLAFVPRRPSLCSLLQFVPLILAQPPVSAAGEFDQTEGGEEAGLPHQFSYCTQFVRCMRDRIFLRSDCAPAYTRAYRFDEFFPSFLAHAAICCFNYLLRHLPQYSAYNVFYLSRESDFDDPPIPSLSPGLLL